MLISKAFCIAALLAVHIYSAQEMKIVKYAKVNKY